MLSAATPLVGLLALGAPRAPKKRYPPPPPPMSPGHRVEITGGAFHRLRQITAEAAKEAIALRGHFAMAIGGDDLIPMLEKMGEYWGGEGEDSTLADATTTTTTTPTAATTTHTPPPAPLATPPRVLSRDAELRTERAHSRDELCSAQGSLL